jgi:hypothetical protein
MPQGTPAADRDIREASGAPAMDPPPASSSLVACVEALLADSRDVLRPDIAESLRGWAGRRTAPQLWPGELPTHAVPHTWGARVPANGCVHPSRFTATRAVPPDARCPRAACGPAVLCRQRVLLRADMNVPLKGRAITDASRCEAVLPTVQALLAHGAKASGPGGAWGGGRGDGRLGMQSRQPQ